jgi:hypothetical protein
VCQLGLRKDIKSFVEESSELKHRLRAMDGEGFGRSINF